MIDFIRARRLRARIQVPLQIFLLMWIVWAINLWSFHESIRGDWSQEAQMAVTPSDRALLDALPRSVDVVIPVDLPPTAAGRVRARVLLQALRWIGELSRTAPDAVSPPIQVDVNRQADRWELLRNARGLEADAINKIHFFCGERRLALDVEELAIIQEPTLMEPEAVARIVVDRVREAVEAALRQVATDQTTEIRISQGSGEPPLNSSRGPSLVAMVRDLQQRGARVAGHSLAIIETIDEEADLLVVLGGGVQRFDALSASVRREVERFLAEGGGVLLLLPASGETGLEELMAGVGISVLPGLAAQVTAVPNRAVQSSFSVVGERLDPFHPITAPMFSERFAARWTPSRVLEVTQPATALLSTGPSAWLERDRISARRDVEELPGPQILAAAAPVGEGRLVVVGNWNTTLSNLWTGDARRFLLACCDWAAGRDLLPAGAGREPLSFRIELDERLRRSFFWTSFAVMPGCALIGGLLVAWARRRDR